MARKRRRNELRAGELNLTAMIDVAFQLLSFFIITVHPVDVLAHLNVNRPSPEPPAKNQPPPPPLKMIQIKVMPEGYEINDRAVSKEMLDALLQKLAALDKTQTVLIMCAAQSPHSKLIEVLDLCAKVKLSNLSVVSGY